MAVADAPLVLVPALLGAGLVVAALEAADAGAAATPFEALLFGCLGVGFAVLFASPALAVALALFVGTLDLAGALAGGPDGLVTTTTTRGGDALALELPDWGTGLVAVRLGVADVVFLAAFATLARRGRALRERAAVAAMLAALLAAVVAEALWDVSLPPLALLAAAYLATNADRLGGLFAPADEG